MSRQPPVDRFKPSWWLPGRHAQTLWPVLTRRVRLEVRSEKLELPDGDCVRLDWAGDGGPPGGPIVILVPGLQGDIGSGYIRGLMRAFQARGWRGVLLNHRGHVEPNRKRQSYHSGLTCDLDYLVRLLAQQEPGVPIAVAGFSLGANICLKWLGECGSRGHELPVVAAVAVATPFNLAAVAENINHGLARIYQWYLLRSLHQDMRRKMAVMSDTLGLTLRELRRLNTFFKFDDRITGPWHGFTGAADYYAKSRCDVLLKHIVVPTLVVCAKNDPLVPAHLLPQAGDVSGQVTLEITEGGGHLGFVSGRWPWAARYWLESRIPEFLAEFFGNGKAEANRGGFEG
jgi:predicted alpha/beta-fold hydrolase